jgi:hypothetical protein
LFQIDKAHNEIQSFTKSERERHAGLRGIEAAIPARDNYGGAPVVVIGFVGSET